MSVYDINGNNLSGTYGQLPNVVFLGDSICTYPNSPAFGGWIFDMNDYISFESLKTYGVGDSTWKVTANRSSMYAQFLTLKDEVDHGRTPPDVIVINAGINDVVYNTPVGTASEAFNGEDILSSDPLTLATLYQSIRYTCEAIIDEYPNAQIILATPYQSGLMAREAGVRNVRDAIIESGARLGLKVINQTDDLPIYNYNESISPHYLRADGTHPSSYGEQLLTRFFVKELPPLVLPEISSD